MQPRSPSGLFPAGPMRPRFREPHPVRSGAIMAGAGMTAVWLLLFGLLAASTRAYIWWTITAVTIAWLAALVLIKYGDRGAGTGVAITAGTGMAISAAVTVVQWATQGWPLW